MFFQNRDDKANDSLIFVKTVSKDINRLMNHYQDTGRRLVGLRPPSDMLLDLQQSLASVYDGVKVCYLMFLYLINHISIISWLFLFVLFFINKATYTLWKVCLFIFWYEILVKYLLQLDLFIYMLKLKLGFVLKAQILIL